MVIVARISFPRRHLNQAVAVYTGLPPLPPGVIKNGPFFQLSKELINAITIFTLPNEGTTAAANILQNRYQAFAAILDFSCDVQEWREFKEFINSWIE